MTTTEPTTPTVTLAYAMADRGLPFLATDGQHYAYGETAERALAELASVATPDPMADQTTWTTHGVSDAERAAIDEGMRRIAAELATAATTTTITETFPAYAADTLGETITLTFPTAWADRVAAIVPVLSYGPNYSRAAIESLADMSRCVRDDYSTVAYDYLLSAERAARRNGIDIPELNA